MYQDDYELGWFEWHTTVSVWMRRLLQWSPFEAIVMLVVLIAGLLVGASTYEDFRRDNAVLFACVPLSQPVARVAHCGAGNVQHAG